MWDLYKRLLDFTRDGVYRYTFEEGQILMANQGLVDILDLGCAPEELFGKRLKDLLIYTEKERTIRKALEATGEIHNFEYHFKTLKGEDKWVLHDSFIVTEPKTKRKIVEAIVKDITFRKKAEQDIAIEKERLSVTLQSIGDAVISTDIEGKIVEMNPVAEQLTGWRYEEARNRLLREIFNIINEETRKQCKNPVELVLKREKIVGLANHTVLISRGGEERIIADSGSPIRDKNGEIIGVVLVFRDVTEQVKMRERLTLSEKLADLGRLAGGIAHEVRNPLCVIKNAAYFLSHSIDQEDPRTKRHLEILDKEVANCERIIAGLLDFARPKPALRSNLEIVNIIHETLSKIEVPENIAVSARLEEKAIIAGNPGELGQIFANIISNAIQAMPDGGKLSIGVKTTCPGWVDISFADTGAGIPLENLAKIYDPLFTTRAKGMGFGLAITRKLIEEHGGTISLKSKVNKGTTFIVRLPGCQAVE